jgi:hypothetical protein
MTLFMVLKEMHKLPDESIAFTYMYTYKKTFLVIEQDHKQSFVRYGKQANTKRQLEDISPDSIQSYINRNDYCITNDLMVISLNLN